MYKLAIAIASVSLFLISGVSQAAETQSQSKETAGQYITDASITTKVKADLLADSDVSSMHISVKTNKHVVTLSGHVDTAEQKEKAVTIVKGIDGVHSVRNHLKVKAS
jgi:hyperosmotically inducible protein